MTMCTRFEMGPTHDKIPHKANPEIIHFDHLWLASKLCRKHPVQQPHIYDLVFKVAFAVKWLGLVLPVNLGAQHGGPGHQGIPPKVRDCSLMCIHNMQLYSIIPCSFPKLIYIFKNSILRTSMEENACTCAFEIRSSEVVLEPWHLNYELTQRSTLTVHRTYKSTVVLR